MARYLRNRSSNFAVQTAPRNRARSDRQFLALNDAGHGSTPETCNPILYGLGVTLQLELNSFVRTWTVEVEAAVGAGVIREDITRFFTQDPNNPQRFLLEGAAGSWPIGPSSGTPTSYTDPVTLVFIVTLSNVRLTTTVRREMVIQNAVPVSHCPVAEDCDFALFEPINRRGIRVFDNMVRRLASENQPVSFFFDTLDALVAKVPELTSLIPFYDQFSTVGIEFHNDGACGPAPEGGIPTSCDSIDCCCTIVPALLSAVYTNTSQANAPVTPGVTTVNTFDVLQITLTIPTTGATSCTGFESLQVVLPGLDRTGGKWNVFDPAQMGGFTPVVTVNGNTVTPVLTQDGVNGGSGSGNSVTLDFSAIPIECGQTIEITWRAYPVLADTDPETFPVTFSEGGPCHLPMGTEFPFGGVGSGGGSITPPHTEETWGEPNNWADGDDWEEQT